MSGELEVKLGRALPKPLPATEGAGELCIMEFMGTPFSVKLGRLVAELPPLRSRFTRLELEDQGSLLITGSGLGAEAGSGSVAANSVMAGEGCEATGAGAAKERPAKS